MDVAKRTRWGEADVLELSAGEHDWFDRKSGLLLNSDDFRRDIAKALSAFANSGGGSIILGVADDGTFDGVVPMHKGRTRTREWLEQVIPRLVDYPLENFRVHEMEPTSPTQVPAGRIVLVIDVGDSRLAPHQSAVDRKYYYRVGGHSQPAPHFYIETLRQRLTGVALTASVQSMDVGGIERVETGIKVAFIARFRIENVGRVAAYKWRFVFDSFDSDDDEAIASNGYWIGAPPRMGPGSISLDDTLLPGLYTDLAPDEFGIVLRPKDYGPAGIATVVAELAAVRWAIVFHVVSETSPGDPLRQEVFTMVSADSLTKRIVDALGLGR